MKRLCFVKLTKQTTDEVLEIALFGETQSGSTFLLG